MKVRQTLFRRISSVVLQIEKERTPPSRVRIKTRVPTSIEGKLQARDWVQHMLDCLGSCRLFDSRLRILCCRGGFHCGFRPSGFPVSGGFGCARILERAQAWKARGQSFPALFSGLASGAGIVHSLPTPLLFGVVRGLAFFLCRCASSVESDGQSSAGPFPGSGFGAWIAHTFHTFR